MNEEKTMTTNDDIIAQGRAALARIVEREANLAALNKQIDADLEVIYGWKIHPLASMFPLMDEQSDEFKDLVASIRANGLLSAIVTDANHLVIDGRNRLRALQVINESLPAGEKKRGIDAAPLAPNHPGMSVEDFIWSANMARRHLTPDQKLAMLLLREHFVPVSKEVAASKGGKAKAAKSAGVAPDTSTKAPVKTPKTRDKLAKTAGVGPTKAQEAMNVASEAPELLPEIVAGKVTVAQATKVVKARKPKAEIVLPDLTPRTVDLVITRAGAKGPTYRKLDEAIADAVTHLTDYLNRMADKIHPEERHDFCFEIGHQVSVWHESVLKKAGL